MLTTRSFPRRSHSAPWLRKRPASPLARFAAFRGPRLPRHRCAWRESGFGDRFAEAAACRTDSRHFRCDRRCSPPRPRLRDRRPFPGQQEPVLVPEPLQAGGRDVVLDPRGRSVVFGFFFGPLLIRLRRFDHDLPGHRAPKTEVPGTAVYGCHAASAPGRLSRPPRDVGPSKGLRQRPQKTPEAGLVYASRPTPIGSDWGASTASRSSGLRH